MYKLLFIFSILFINSGLIFGSEKEDAFYERLNSSEKLICKTAFNRTRLEFDMVEQKLVKGIVNRNDDGIHSYLFPEETFNGGYAFEYTDEGYLHYSHYRMRRDIWGEEEIVCLDHQFALAPLVDTWKDRIFARNRFDAVIAFAWCHPAPGWGWQNPIIYIELKCKMRGRQDS